MAVCQQQLCRSFDYFQSLIDMVGFFCIPVNENISGYMFSSISMKLPERYTCRFMLQVDSINISPVKYSSISSHHLFFSWSLLLVLSNCFVKCHSFGPYIAGHPWDLINGLSLAYIAVFVRDYELTSSHFPRRC